MKAITDLASMDPEFAHKALGRWHLHLTLHRHLPLH